MIRSRGLSGRAFLPARAQWDRRRDGSLITGILLDARDAAQASSQAPLGVLRILRPLGGTLPPAGIARLLIAGAVTVAIAAMYWCFLEAPKATNSNRRSWTDPRWNVHNKVITRTAKPDAAFGFYAT